MEHPIIPRFDNLVPRESEKLDRPPTTAEQFLHALGRQYSLTSCRYPSGIFDAVTDVVNGMTSDEQAELLKCVHGSDLVKLWANDAQHISKEQLSTCNPDWLSYMVEVLTDDIAFEHLGEEFVAMVERNTPPGQDPHATINALLDAGYFGPLPEGS